MKLERFARRTRRLAGFALAACLLTACHGAAPAAFGPARPPDPATSPFHSDAMQRWGDFRLGAGLNAIVVSPSLPREPDWRFQAGRDGISSSPVVYRKLVLVASNDKRLYAIDASSGASVWQYLATNQLMTQPLYARGLAIVASGNRECVVCMPPDYVVGGTGSNRVAAVDLQTGRERWGQIIGGTGMPTGTLSGDEFVHADGSGVVLALDLSTGAYRWHVRLPSIFAMSSVVDGGDGRLYVSGTFPSSVYALDAVTGRPIWQTRLARWDQGSGDGPMASTPRLLFAQYLRPLRAAKLGLVVTDAMPVAHHVYAIERGTGRITWDREVARGPFTAYNQAAIPLVYRDALYLGSSAGDVVTALDVASGVLRWQRRVGGLVRGGIVARDGVLYFGDTGGFLWAVRAADGSVLGALHTNLTYEVGSPIVLNDSLIVGSKQGTVLAIPLRRILGAHDATNG